jgi:DNA polymerase-1
MKIIIDGDNLIHAAYFVTKDVPDELRVKKTVGLFFMMMEKYKRDFNVKKLYITWDGREGKLWRQAILPEYKSNRTHNKVISKCIKRASKRFENGYIHIQKLDSEGDDLIYALCRCLNNSKIIVSADKDFIQVVQEDLAEAVFNPITKKYRDVPEIDSVIEKSIVGDPSDNLKGILGKGPKSIAKLIVEDYKSLTKEETIVFNKHLIVIGLKNNPKKDELLDWVDTYLYSMEKGF